MMRDRFLILICAGLIPVLASNPPAFAHGTPHPVPTPDEAAQIPAPVPGAREFFQELSTHARTLVREALAPRLAEAARHYGFADALEDPASGAGPHDAAYNRSLAEEALLALAETMPDAIVLDFRGQGPDPDPHAPIPLAGQASQLLLRVITGDGPPQFRVQHVNLTSSGDGKPFIVPVAASAVTHLILDLEEVPSGASTLIMAFREEGSPDPAYWHAVTVRPEPLGQLRVEIRDEKDGSTPAFVRLVALRNDKSWEPPNAVDLAPIMTSVTGLPIYGPGRGYTHYMPGAFRGTYWIVPGPFDMALPPGEWEITIHHGAEYVPLREVFTIAEAQWTRKTFRLSRWTDMPARGWWSGDDHVHARLMSSEDADRLMAFVRAADIHVANILEMGNQDRTWYAQRGFGPEFRVQAGSHVLVPGQEDPRSAFGHSIGMNITALARDLDRYMLTDWVADEIHRQGGLFGHTHVGEGGLGIHRDMTLLMPRGKSDFGSIMQNVLGTERYYDFLDLGFRLTASAGTDTPYGGAVGVVRCYAYLGEGEPFSADAWFAAVKQGRTFVTNGPMLDLRVDDAFPGDELLLDEDRPLRVRAKAWGLTGGSAPARLELVRCSDVVEEAVSTDPAHESLEIDLSIDSGYGFWIAARATGHDGSQGHTTPVYVTRQGFRPWNADRAESLIADRMATLDEIEQMVNDAERRLLAGELQRLDNWNTLMGRQAPQVRERVVLVRALYEDLRETLRREAVLRRQ